MSKDSLSNDLKGGKGLRRVRNAFFYSRDGLREVWRHEAAFRQLCFLHGVLLLLLFFIDIPLVSKVLLILVSVLSLVVELINSAIEATVDYVSLDLHPLAKRAKDAGSAAQLLMLVLTGVAWVLLVFL